MKKIAFILLLSSCALIANAQTEQVKIGYADIEYILTELPATKKVEVDLTSMKTQLSNQFDIKQKELEKKYKDFIAAGEKMPEAVRTNTLRELEMLKANLDRFSEDAQVSLQKKQEELLAPIYESIRDAIGEVAKENGFTFILNPKVSGLDVVLFGEEKWDVSDLVLKKLGVTPKAAANTPVSKD